MYLSKPPFATGNSIMLLRIQFCSRSFAGDFTDHGQTVYNNQLGRSLLSVSYSALPQPKNHHCTRSKQVVVSCISSQSKKDNYEYKDDDDYLEAVFLMPETLRHYQMHMCRQGFEEAIKWLPSTGKLFPLSYRTEQLLSIYQTPTIFLKVFGDCDGDYWLPIALEECIIERLIRSSLEDEGSPDRFQLVRYILGGKTGYQVKMVQIIKVGDGNNTAMANICFHKPGTEDIRVDARLSDAINVAKQCRAPIYVSKQIVLTYADPLFTKTGILRDKRPVYEAYLDSAIDGPEVLEKEFDLVTKLNLAVKEERYSDAAIFRHNLLTLYS